MGTKTNHPDTNRLKRPDKTVLITFTTGNQKQLADFFLETKNTFDNQQSQNKQNYVLKHRTGFRRINLKTSH